MSRFNQGGPGRGPGYVNNPGRDRPSVSPEKLITDLWPAYLEGGYFDDQGCLKLEYVSRERVDPFVKAMCQARPGLTTHQVRRYFGHCRAIETRLRGGASWASLHPDVKKLDIAAADGAAKQPAKIPRLYHDFIRRNVDKIRTQKDFLEGFLPHFEALVGFGQAHFDKGRN